MRAKHINQWLKRNREKYIHLMQLDDWNINIYVIDKKNPLTKKKNVALEEKSLSDRGAAGTCRTWFEYKLAMITIFAVNIDNQHDLLRIYVHELAHVATSYFKLYSKYFRDHVLYLESTKAISKKIESDVSELLAVQLENIILGKEKSKSYITTKMDPFVEDVLECLSQKYRKPVVIINEHDIAKKEIKQQKPLENKNSNKELILPFSLKK